MAIKAFRVLVNDKNSLLAVWGEQAVFHEIMSDNLFLVTALATRVLNRLPREEVSDELLRQIIRNESEGQSLNDRGCEEFIHSLVEKRLVQQLQL